MKKNKLIKYSIKYFLLTAILFFFYYLGDYLFNISEQTNPYLMFLFWLISISLADLSLEKILR